MKKFIKYLGILLLSIVIAKWVVMLLPTSQNQPVTTQNKYITTPKEEMIPLQRLCKE